MKTKVIIENGLTKIVMTPENDFETDVLDKVYRKKQNYEIETSVTAEYYYNEYKNHTLTATLKEIKP